jgi:Ni/Fe-hydrogenase subunit HybB-like protein
MAYMVVLWIELSPAFLEKLGEGKGAIAGVARRVGPVLEKALVWIIALGMLLPTMHQSSLGSLMLLTGPKLHPLWQTPLLPLLFLVSCVAMGFAAVVFESALSSYFFRRKPETEMLAGLAGATAPVLGGFVLLRVADLVWRGQIARAFAFDRYAVAFWVEGALCVAGLVMLLQRNRRRDLGHLFRAAMLIMLGGGLYRFNTYLVAYRPGDDVSYFPSVPELTITLGLVAFEILAYVTIVKIFPILSGAPRAAAER